MVEYAVSEGFSPSTSGIQGALNHTYEQNANARWLDWLLHGRLLRGLLLGGMTIILSWLILAKGMVGFGVFRRE